jgi:ornithine cyclodeaminase/alanine dehydrogenase-like protein (mu-crystallin family)
MLKTEAQLLRLKEEPCNYFSEAAIHQFLMKNARQYMNALEKFYILWKRRKSMVSYPRKQLFQTAGLKGDFRVMPCVITGLKRTPIKAVKIIGTNEEERTLKDKISVGKALLLHPHDNYVQGIFDVCAFSSFRTAAISVLVFKHLVEKSNGPVAIVGAGRIGYYTAMLLQDWLKVKNFYLVDPNKRRASLLRQLIEKKKASSEILTLKKACSSVQALFLATDSTSALVDARNAGNVDFVSSVGADCDYLSEVDKSLLKERRIITDSLDNIYFGDLNRWRKQGLLKESRVEDFRTIIGKKQRTKTTKLFISTGTAVQDAFTCHFLFNHIR